MLNLPREVLEILNKIKAANFKAYCVGGSIRDLLLGKETHDFDFATNATPNQIKHIFRNYFILTIGEKYGTITVQYNENFYEITTFRKETIYEDYRRPKMVEFTDDLYTDLSRRDFTINAFAYNQEEGLIDYFNGLEDLHKKIIRCVGDPMKRFNEDALRIIRAIRFAISLGFMIDDKTLEAMKKLKNNLQYISIERLRNEFFKILLYLNYESWIKYKEYFIVFLPQLTQIQDDEYLFKVYENLEQDPLVRLAFLFAKSKINAIEVMTSLKCSRKEIKIVTTITNYLNIQMANGKPFIKRIIRKVPIEIFDKVLNIHLVIAKVNRDIMYEQIVNDCKKLLNEIITNNEPYSFKDLAITGNDLLKMGLEEGTIIYKILNQCLQIVIDNPNLNNKEYLVSYVKDIFLQLEKE